MAQSSPILLVGCGKMGGAMLAGWLGRGMNAADIVAVEPSRELADVLREQ
ncbi:MAG: NAD(P)-binding domain-containing protein, partial [Rhodospirillaceae bacterium]|nr:NAD(P)-binding domain-containing protein [Rhodospirillaceae bacterium]